MAGLIAEFQKIGKSILNIHILLEQNIFAMIESLLYLLYYVSQNIFKTFL